MLLMDQKDFAQMIRQRREALNLTTERVADMVGVTASMISQYEHGRTPLKNMTAGLGSAGRILAPAFGVYLRVAATKGR